MRPQHALHETTACRAQHGRGLGGRRVYINMGGGATCMLCCGWPGAGPAVCPLAQWPFNHTISLHCLPSPTSSFLQQVRVPSDMYRVQQGRQRPRDRGAGGCSRCPPVLTCEPVQQPGCLPCLSAWLPAKSGRWAASRQVCNCSKCHAPFLAVQATCNPDLASMKPLKLRSLPNWSCCAT